MKINNLCLILLLSTPGILEWGYMGATNESAKIY